MRLVQFSPALATAHREALGLSRVAAARQVGLSRQGLINIEDGDSIPSVATLSRMAEAYNRTPDEFFTDGEDPTAASQTQAPTDAARRPPVGA